MPAMPYAAFARILGVVSLTVLLSAFAVCLFSAEPLWGAASSVSGIVIGGLAYRLNLRDSVEALTSDEGWTKQSKLPGLSMILNTVGLFLYLLLAIAA